MPQVIESGDGSSQTAFVREGSLQTLVENVVEAKGVATSAITRKDETFDSSGTTLVAANSARTQIQIQNLDASENIYIRLKDEAASTTDLRIGPGETYSFPPGAVYTGVIRATTDSGSATAVVVEF